MISYIEYLGLPGVVGVAIIGLFAVSQIIGELLELKGKVVPELMKVRKIFARRKQEREKLHAMFDILDEVKATIKEFNQHYGTDNIKMRDEWIKGVNDKLDRHDEWVRDFSMKLDQNNKDTLELLIENMRSEIIGFAARVADKNAPVTREQFNRVFKIHQRYEKLIEDHGLVNGEVDISYRLIRESYENHLKNHTFIENVRGYE